MACDIPAGGPGRLDRHQKDEIHAILRDALAGRGEVDGPVASVPATDDGEDVAHDGRQRALVHED